jgi:DHA1 family tetracycline resistance protein-like MFS transporter
VLAFENFVLLMAVVFGLQFVDRSFGPVLPLYVAELGTPVARVPLVAGVLFSVLAASGALGNRLCDRLLRHMSPRALIAGCGVTAACGALVALVAPHPAWLFLALPVFGVAMGTASTTAYTAASSVMPATARGAGFGLLSTAALAGLALSPIMAGILGAVSIRAVFLLDVVALAALAAVVLRLMAISPREKPTTPEPQEV